MKNRSKLLLADKCHELITLCRKVLKQYPNNERFALTLEIRSSTRAMHRFAIRVGQADHKKKLLDTLDEEVQVFRTLIYDSKHYGYINFDTYEQLSYYIAEIGSMVGKWKKNLKDESDKSKHAAIKRYNKD